MKTYELVVPCHFGLEAVLKREIYDLGYEISRVEDGRVSFQGDAEAVCRANIFLRTAERVLIEVGRFRATTFEELFQGIKALPWEDYIPVNGKFWVKKASSIKSKLFSPSDIQSIAKKAMVERMKQYYDVEWFAEDGAPYPVRIFLLKDGDAGYVRGLPAQARIPHIDEQGASDRDAGSFPAAVDAVETGPDSGGSVLRQRYVPD